MMDFFEKTMVVLLIVTFISMLLIGFGWFSDVVCHTKPNYETLDEYDHALYCTNGTKIELREGFKMYNISLDEQQYKDMMECLKGYSDVVSNFKFIQRVELLIDYLEKLENKDV